MPLTRPAALLLLLVAACTGSGDGTGIERATTPLTPAVSDSAGVTIKAHPADALASAPLLTLDSVPLAVFSGDMDDPTLDVSALRWPIFLTSGDLAGWDWQTQELIFLRVAGGDRVRRGRPGGGPLEIGFAGTLVALEDDSLMFDDFQNDRIAIAHPDTGVTRTIAKNSVEGLRDSDLIGRLGGAAGTYLLDVPNPEGSGPPSAGVINPPRFLGLWSATRDSVEARFSVAAGPRVWVELGPGISQYVLGLAPTTSIGRWGDGFLVARGSSWELERWDTAGQLREVVRIDAPATLVDAAMFEASVQHQTEDLVESFESAGRTANPDSIMTAIRSRGHADTLAAYGSVFVSPGGTIWVTDYRMPGATGWKATALAPDGRILGRIERASGEPPVAWGNDRVAITSEDELGIATITVYRVVGL